MYIKRIIACITLVFMLQCTVFAASSSEKELKAELAAAFFQEGVLYSFTDFSQNTELKSLKYSAFVNSISFPKVGQDAPAKVADTSTPMHYLLLVDNSGSSLPYKSAINTFTKAFVTGKADNQSFTVATFGKDFSEPLKQSLNKSEVIKVVESLQLNEEQTSLYSGIIKAIDSIAVKERKEGELFNIIVITDGLEVNENGATQLEVLLRLKSAPQVFLHTFALTNGGANATEALKLLGSFARETKGRHTALSQGVQNAANEITEYLNSLVRMRFQELETKASPKNLQLLVKQGEQSVITELYDVKSVSKAIIVQEPQEVPEQSSEGTATSPENETPIAEIVAVQIPFTPYIYYVGALALAFILYFILYFVFTRKKKNSSSQSSVFMRLVIESGSCKNSENALYLDKELLIGSSRGAQIRFIGNDIHKKHARIYIDEGAIYIENLALSSETLLCGKTIYYPMVLRSGDEISIPSAKFTLKF